MPTKEHLALDSLTDEALNDKWIRTFERLSLLKAVNTWKISNEEAKANFEEIEILSDLFDRIQLEQSARGKNTETPKERSLRLIARVHEERSKGTRPFLKTVAKEEGISPSRLKQIIGNQSVESPKPTNPWRDLSSSTAKPSSKKVKSKN